MNATDIFLGMKRSDWIKYSSELDYAGQFRFESCFAHKLKARFAFSKRTNETITEPPTTDNVERSSCGAVTSIHNDHGKREQVFRFKCVVCFDMRRLVVRYHLVSQNRNWQTKKSSNHRSKQ
jgi:hypothetical protein